MRSEEGKIAAEYLMQIRWIDKRVKQCAEVLSEQRELIYSLKSPLYESEVKGCSDPDKFTQAIAKLEELECKLNDAIDELTDLKIEAFEAIERMKNIKHRHLLTARYIQLKTTARIAEELNEDKRNVDRQINRALHKFYEINIYKCRN